DVAAAAAYELVVLARGDEADLLAVFLVRHAQPQLAGQLANLRLVVLSHGKQHAGQERPLHAEQHVRLVLAVIDAAAQGGQAAGEASPWRMKTPITSWPC